LGLLFWPENSIDHGSVNPLSPKQIPAALIIRSARALRE
jgi:hypothetical protein